MSDIFVSYRRDDSSAATQSLIERLGKAFCRRKVFRDLDDLGAGGFSEQIREKIERCGVFVLVIGKDWVTISNSKGEPRLLDPTDVHRQEIESALSLRKVQIIPVLVEGARVPEPESLPKSLRGLTRLQFFEILTGTAQSHQSYSTLIEHIKAVKHVKPGVCLSSLLYVFGSNYLVFIAVFSVFLTSFTSILAVLYLTSVDRPQEDISQETKESIPAPLPPDRGASVTNSGKITVHEGSKVGGCVNAGVMLGDCNSGNQ